MATLKVAEAAILAAVESAIVDLAAPPEDRFQFERRSLKQLMEQYKRPDGEDLVIRAWNRTQRQLLDRAPQAGTTNSGEAQQAQRLLQIHLAVRDRLQAIRDVRYRETEQVLSSPRRRADSRGR